MLSSSNSFRSLLLVACAVSAGVAMVAVPSSASADVAPSNASRVICYGPNGDKCTSCEMPLWYNSDSSTQLADYNTCATQAKASGLIQQECTGYHGGGGSRTYYFCPKGVTLTKKTIGGGCSIGGEPDSWFGLAGLALVLGYVGVRVRRRRFR